MIRCGRLWIRTSRGWRRSRELGGLVSSRVLEIGRLEDGSCFVLDIVTTPFHWLVSGITGRVSRGRFGRFCGRRRCDLQEGSAGSAAPWSWGAIDPAMGMELTAGDEAGLFTHFVKAELPAWFTEKTEAEQEAWIDAGGDVTKLDPKFQAKVAA